VVRSFVGRHIVSSLIADDDTVTLFHRGETNPDLLPGLSIAWGTATWTCRVGLGSWDVHHRHLGLRARQVRTLAQALDGRGGRYVQISTVSVYDTPQGAGMTEHSPLVVLDDRRPKW